MFEYIKGPVAKKTFDYVVIDVNGIGFKIFSSMTSIASHEEGEIATYYTYMNVKEDDISLFGFSTEEELNAFNLLISVNGVGPKMALAVLSQMSVTDLSMALASGDFKTISKAKGIGPKLAQRIVLELKDKLKSSSPEDFQLISGGNQTKSVAAGLIEEATEALLVLGFNQQKARAMVESVYENGMTLEEIVKKAIKM